MLPNSWSRRNNSRAESGVSTHNMSNNPDISPALLCYKSCRNERFLMIRPLSQHWLVSYIDFQWDLNTTICWLIPPTACNCILIGPSISLCHGHGVLIWFLRKKQTKNKPFLSCQIQLTHAALLIWEGCVADAHFLHSQDLFFAFQQAGHMRNHQIWDFV